MNHRDPFLTALAIESIWMIVFDFVLHVRSATQRASVKINFVKASRSRASRSLKNRGFASRRRGYGVT